MSHDAPSWTPATIPDLTGTTAVVTGANSGLGLHTSIALAKAGAHVVLGCRDPRRGDEALGQVRVQGAPDGHPTASAELVQLDLADLESIRQAAEQITASHPSLGLLVNNAGVMAIPRRETADGFEMQLGTNHLGHVALTAQLLPALLRGGIVDGPPRVVTVASSAHRMGKVDRDDLMGERNYRRWGAYGQSKLANLLFTHALQRRADEAGGRLLALAAHPGFAATGLQTVGPSMSSNPLVRKVGEVLAAAGNAVFGQPAEMGAWPSLRAATDAGLAGGTYVGPAGIAESRGAPVIVGQHERALDVDTQEWLWQRSLELTGVDFDELAPVA